MLPNADWIARAQAADDKSTVQAPTGDESELVVFIRAKYIIPSQLAPQKDWPSVGTDLFELGRFNMQELRRRVRGALEQSGDIATASRIDVGGPKLVE